MVISINLITVDLNGTFEALSGCVKFAALLMDQAVRNLMIYADIPFEIAVVSATRSPARLLNLDREVGTIEAGKRADLSVWSDDYAVLSTIVGGLPVFGGAHLYRPSRTASA